MPLRSWPWPPRTRLFPTAYLGAVVLTLASSVLGQSHRIRFDRLSVEEGLSQGSANVVLQDSLGFVWIGTQDGLNRYDGYRVDVFRHDPSDPDSLPTNFVTSLLEDRHQRLWIFFDQPGVLSSYDLHTGRFQRYAHRPGDSRSLLPYADHSGNPGSPRRYDVRGVHEEEDGTLWIGTQGGGVNKLDPATGEVTRIVPDPEDPASLSHGYVDTIFEDSAGTLWIATRGGGLNRRLTPHGGVERFARYRHDPENPASLSHDDLFGILEDSTGALWIGTRGGGLNRLDPERGSFERFLDSEEQIVELQAVAPALEDSAGRIWIEAAAGVLAYDPKNDRFSEYRHDPEDPSSLSHQRGSVRTGGQSRSALGRR